MVSNAAKALLSEFRSEVEHFCADVYYDQLRCEKPMVHLVPVEMVDLVRELLSKFMRSKAIPLIPKEILKVDVRSRDLQLSNKRLSVGQFCYIAMNKARVEKKI